MQSILQDLMKKNILGTSDAWSTSRLFHRPREPAHYIVDYLILGVCPEDHIDVRNVTCVPDLHNCIGNHRCEPERLQEIIGLNLTIMYINHSLQFFVTSNS